MKSAARPPSRRRRAVGGLLLISAAALSPSAAGAAQSEGAAKTSYPPEFFAEAAPVTALDMIGRLPGFTLNAGAGVRGLAGSTPNILVNGRVPVTRSESIGAILSRIPADEVERIDVLRGSAPGIYFQGHQEVANVIRRKTSSSWAAATGGMSFIGGFFQPSLRLDGGHYDPRHSADGSANIYRSEGDSSGSRLIVFDRLGRLASRSRLDTTYVSSGLSGSVRAEKRFNEGTSLALNGSHSSSSNASMVRSVTLLLDEARPDYQYSSETSGDYNDLGAEFETQVAGSTNLRLNLARTFGLSETADTYQDDFREAETLSSYRYGETVARCLLIRAAGPLHLETGAEVARNKVSSTFQLFEGGTETEIPSDEVIISERRFEAHVEAQWTPNPKLTLNATLRYENSALRLAGDDPLERTFSYLKPRFAATYAPAPDTTLRLRVEREVSQLNFSIFAASAVLETQIVNAGNPKIEPERAWTFEAAAQRRFWTKGAVDLALTHSSVQGLIDYFRIDNFDALGNIGPARKWQIAGKLTVPLDRLGVRGGLINATSSWRWSRLRDPTTGLRRRLSGEAPFGFSIAFSQDLLKPKGTWGASYNFAPETRTYRFAEESFSRGVDTFQIYFEAKPTPKWSIKSEFNFAEAISISRRTLYDGSRAAGVVSSLEERRTRSDASFRLSVRRAL